MRRLYALPRSLGVQEELARNFDRLDKKAIKEIQSGTLVDWANENAAESYIIYDMAQEGDELFAILQPCVAYSAETDHLCRISPRENPERVLRQERHGEHCQIH